MHPIGVLTRIAKDGTRARAIISWPLRAIQVKARYPGQGEHASRYHANPAPMQYPCQLDLGCAGTPLKRKHFIPGLRSELMSGPPPAPSTLRPPAPTHHTLAFTPYRPETDISRYTLQARSQTLAGTPYRPDPTAKLPASAAPCLPAARDPFRKRFRNWFLQLI